MPDAIVVGSGPLGTACAIELAGRGLTVTVLEAGGAVTTPPGAHLRNQARFRDDPDAFFPAVGGHLVPVNPDPAENDLPEAFDAALFGGQGVLWTNNCPRAEPFERWENMGAAEWEAHYARAETLLRVVQEPTAASRTGALAAERLRPHLAAEGREIRGLPLSGRVEGTGIHFHAPADFLALAGPEVRARIEILPETRATRLVHEGGRVAAVALEAGGEIATTEVLLAGGVIGAPRLLHASGIRPEALGRSFSFHQILFGQIVLGEDLAAPDGDIPPRLVVPPTPAKPWHIQVLRDTCPLPAEEAVANPHRLLEFQAFLPVAFQQDSALVFDEAGRAAFRYRPTEADLMGMEAMRLDVMELAARLGPWRRGCEPIFLPPGNHLVGTCRQDLPGRPGVADAEGLVHGFGNLRLATLGLIPAPSAVNPTLTALALSLRASDAMAAR